MKDFMIVSERILLHIGAVNNEITFLIRFFTEREHIKYRGISRLSPYHSGLGSIPAWAFSCMSSPLSLPFLSLSSYHYPIKLYLRQSGHMSRLELAVQPCLNSSSLASLGSC